MQFKPLQLIGLATAISLGMALSENALAQTGSPSSAYPGSSNSSPASNNSSPGSASSSAEFSKLDTNGDGYISKKEAAKNKDLSKKFDGLDVTKSGKLSPADFAQFEAMQKGNEGSTPKQ